MESKEATEGKRIHYGSLEGVALEHMETGGAMSSAVLAGIKAGNINISETGRYVHACMASHLQHAYT